MYEILLLVHLVSASVWLGGMILMGAFVPVLRNFENGSVITKSLAQRFGQIGWSVYTLSLFTGMGMYYYAWNSSIVNNYFHLKMGLFLFAGALTFAHSKFTDLKPQFKGMIQGLILLSTIGIFYSAIMFTG